MMCLICLSRLACAKPGEVGVTAACGTTVGVAIYHAQSSRVPPNPAAEPLAVSFLNSFGMNRYFYNYMMLMKNHVIVKNVCSAGRSPDVR